ncbi:MAG TPA: hypothetical protein VFL64_17240 [Rhizobacter sp.]|nr:hypothetical protein [Rhizobacter sp.]
MLLLLWPLAARSLKKQLRLPLLLPLRPWLPWLMPPLRLLPPPQPLPPLRLPALRLLPRPWLALLRPLPLLLPSNRVPADSKGRLRAAFSWALYCAFAFS